MSVETLERPEPARKAMFRRHRRWPVWLPVVAAAGWALVRATGAERGMIPVQLMAFTPYVAAAATLLPPATAVIALATRQRGSRVHRWSPVVASTMVAMMLAWFVVPRAISDEGTAADHSHGPVLRVMTSNLLGGGASPAAIVELAERRDVDVLAVQELAPQAKADLEQTGLTRLFPYQAAYAEPGPAGSGLYSRFPIRSVRERWLAGDFACATATVAVPGARPVVVESVHTYAPVSDAATADWFAGFAQLPAATPSGPIQVLLGDFNATLDHAPLRRLLATGYRDAAATRGAGLVATWPFDGRRVPKVTIDHVLADPRVGIREVWVQPVPGSDHRALLADLVLPSV